MNEPGRLFSLKRRLLLALLGAITLVWLAAAALYLFRCAGRDQRAARRAPRAVGVPDRRASWPRIRRDRPRARAAIAQAQPECCIPDLGTRPDPAPAFGERAAGAPLGAGGGLQQHGDRRQRLAGVQRLGWRAPGSWCRLARRDETRRELAASVATSLLAPLLLALPALGLFVWFSITRAAQAASDARRQVEQRRPDNLAALRIDGAPVEVAPLVNSLNALFGRVSRLIENERRFTADAAHELRTAAGGAQDPGPGGARRRRRRRAPARAGQRHRGLRSRTPAGRAAADARPPRAGSDRGQEPCDLRTLASRRSRICARRTVPQHRNRADGRRAGRRSTVYPGLIGYCCATSSSNAIATARAAPPCKSYAAANTENAALARGDRRGPRVLPGGAHPGRAAFPIAILGAGKSAAVWGCLS